MPAAPAGSKCHRESTLSTSVDPAELLAAQRVLRDRILCGKGGVEARQQRDLAAEMLLYLDDPQSCWQASARWLMSVTAAHRIDAGFSSAQDACYRPMFELVRADVMLPSVVGAAMDARDPGIACVWESSRVVVLDDVGGDRRLGTDLRAALFAAGTRRKLAVALRDAQGDVGLMCVDAVAGAAWRADECTQFDNVARNVIAPILAAARRLTVESVESADSDRAACRAGAAQRPEECRGLTPAELRVAHLVLAGCSYKEIARKLGRSASTIDHHLRSMREKLGVNSTAKLMRDLIVLIPSVLPAGSNNGHH